LIKSSLSRRTTNIEISRVVVLRWDYRGRGSASAGSETTYRFRRNVWIELFLEICLEQADLLGNFRA
jgi:hypothetical protein